MTRLAGLLLAPVAFVLVSCGSSPVSGEVIEKDYDAATTKRVEKCANKTVDGKTKRVCKTETKRVPEEWDITVRTADGDEVEIDVDEDEFDSIQVGDRYDSGSR